MNSVRFIHTSDWQLGMTRRFLSDEAAPRFSQDRIEAITQLGELAKDQDAKFIIVAGDVFESNQLSRQVVLRTLDALNALPVPIFLLPGNHDPLDASSIFSTPEFLAADQHIIVIHDSKPVAVPGLSNVEIVGAPWRTKHPNSDLCDEMLTQLKPTDDCLRIAVCHGQTDSLSPDLQRPEIINLSKAETAIKEGVIHYLGLGDRHSVTKVGTTDRIWYSGAPVATAFTENDPNKALVVTLTGSADCEVTAHEIGKWQFIAEQKELNTAEELETLTQWLADFSDKARTIVKLGFTGTINLQLAAQLDELLETQAELFASLKKRERTMDLTIAPDQLDQDSVSLSGYAREAWDELLKEAKNDPVAENALRLFYRLSKQGDQQ